MPWSPPGRSRPPARRVPPRRPSPRGRPGSRGGGDEGLGKYLPFAVLAMLAAGALWFWTLVPDAVPRDRDTFCPLAGPDSLTVVLIDTTGNYDGITQRDVFSRLEGLLAGSTVDDRFVVFNMRGDEPEGPGPDGLLRWSGPETIVQVCNPGDPGDANPLFENVAMVERAMNGKFLEPIRAALRDLVRVDALADFSPLLESVQVVAVEILALPEHRSVPRRLVLVTDLIQNSATLSFQGTGPPSWDDFSGTPEARALAADLSGVKVEILFHERRQHAGFGARGARDVIDWWDRWFDGQGAVVTAVDRLTGRT